MDPRSTRPNLRVGRPAPGHLSVIGRAAGPMSDSDAELERRLAAVERAIDGEASLEQREREGSDADELASRVEALEDRVEELDAAIQSVRGFLGGVSAVNESVERRADAAVAAVERLERRLDAGGDALDTPESSDEPTERDLRERLRDLG